MSECRVHDDLRPGCPDCFPHLRPLSLHVGEPAVPVSALRALVEDYKPGKYPAYPADSLDLLCKSLAALCDAAASPERADYKESDGPRPPGRDDGRRT